MDDRSFSRRLNHCALSLTKHLSVSGGGPTRYVHDNSTLKGLSIKGGLQWETGKQEASKMNLNRKRVGIGIRLIPPKQNHHGLRFGTKPDVLDFIRSIAAGSDLEGLGRVQVLNAGGDRRGSPKGHATISFALQTINKARSRGQIC